MNNIAVRAEGLGKQYQIGGAQPAASSLRQSLVGAVADIWRRLSQPHIRGKAEPFWALSDVSFDIHQGEVLGIIGRNGAGKSTLLKVLSRITPPSRGRVEINGRIGSLLEVGTGFHPELTGRENIYMNGAILGMKRSEIRDQFDEIVEFASIGRFLDTPVKRYSSGMYVRLAFAVAAHLDPDILIVDEVLAMGDVEFQRKCLGRMSQSAQEGRTVLLVSHNMSSIKSLCDRALLLEQGQVAAQGDVDKVVDQYLKSGLPAEDGVVKEGVPRRGMGYAQVRRVELKNLDDEPVRQLYFGQQLQVVMTLEAQQAVQDAVIEVDISTLDGTYVTTSLNVDNDRPPMALSNGWHRVSLDLDAHLLPGQYTIDVGLHHTGPPGMIDFVRRTLDFEVMNVSESGADAYPFHFNRGFVRPSGEWHQPEPAERLVS